MTMKMMALLSSDSASEPLLIKLVFCQGNVLSCLTGVQSLKLEINNL